MNVIMQVFWTVTCMLSISAIMLVNEANNIKNETYDEYIKNNIKFGSLELLIPAIIKLIVIIVSRIYHYIYLRRIAIFNMRLREMLMLPPIPENRRHENEQPHGATLADN
nr:PREDICTED: uncharacterized protein LOC105674169 isoform X2 [Linepithema humile]